jgi:hypothetical protein
MRKLSSWRRSRVQSPQLAEVALSRGRNNALGNGPGGVALLVRPESAVDFCGAGSASVAGGSAEFAKGGRVVLNLEPPGRKPRDSYPMRILTIGAKEEFSLIWTSRAVRSESMNGGSDVTVEPDAPVLHPADYICSDHCAKRHNFGNLQIPSERK